MAERKLLKRIWLIIEIVPPQETCYEVERQAGKAIAVKSLRELQDRNKDRKYVLVEAWE